MYELSFGLGLVLESLLQDNGTFDIQKDLEERKIRRMLLSLLSLTGGIMVDEKDIFDLLAVFLAVFPDQRERHREVREYVEACGKGACCDRKNFRGHLTVSGFIFSRDGDSVLMLRHRALGRWLQPGGHLEPSDPSLAYALFREVCEETGLAATDLEVLVPRGVLLLSSRAGGVAPGEHLPDSVAGKDPMQVNGGVIPFGLNSHPIPANPLKNEAAHVHYDFRFALRYAGDPDTIRCRAEESEGFRWVALDALRNDPDFGEVALRAGVLVPLPAECAVPR